MLGHLFRFEARYQLRQPLFWATGLFFAFMTFMAVTSDAVSIGGSIGNVHRNAPYVILQFLGIMSVMALFVVTAFVASAALRDFDRNTHELFFSKPITKRDYLLGRFGGSLLASMGVMVVCALGIWLGSLMPWLEAERLGPFRLGPYLFGLLVLALPSLFFIASLFFTLAVVSRSWLTTYVGVAVFFAAWAVSTQLFQSMDARSTAAMLDPFGLSAFELATRYWTVAERNTAVPALTGYLLWNRLLWSGIACLCFAVGYRAFRPTARLEGRRRKGRSVEEPAAERPASLALPAASRRYDGWARWKQTWSVMRFETRTVLTSIPFLIMLLIGLVNFVLSQDVSENLYGTRVYPVTRLMLDLLDGTFNFYLVIIITLFAGEMVGRERAHSVAEAHGSLPIPDWMPLVGKLSALIAVIVVFLGAGILTATIYQVAVGYYHIEPLLYFKGFLVNFWPFTLIAMLAVFWQAASPNKFVGYLGMVVFLISGVVLRALDFDHNLYVFAASPSTPYSDLNGYGHFVAPFVWFMVYWSFLALALVALGAMLWIRGTETAWKSRRSLAAARFRGPVRVLAAVGLTGFVATGAWIYYNTNVLNLYVPDDQREAKQADYEKKYSQYRDLPMPRIVDVQTAVDIFPEERRVHLAGTYHLVNQEAAPIDAVHVTLDPRVKVDTFDLPGAERTDFDARLGYSIYRLSPPLAPGAETDLRFDLSLAYHGFENDRSDTSLVANGTFFNNLQYFPRLGFDEGARLLDRNKRKKNGLPPVIRTRKVDDPQGLRNTPLAHDSDWIHFATTVSTSDDQIALAPGYLVKDWQEGGRHYYRYEMDSPILHFYSYLSARWEVARDRWGEVPIEIYHHPDHSMNVGRMIDGVKKSLDYFTRELGPYQHRQVRILEVPGYQQFAQSFPNTIPFSERIGFVADLRDPDAIDYVFYVTAHEVAHQWWGHQVCSGDVQGSTMLIESLAQYSALMVMEKEYGREKMRRFLKYELDRYLQRRSGELVEEMPLVLVENQPYIHYNKGSLVFYALREAIGEEALNGALSRFVADKKFQRPPFTTSMELLGYLREATPPELQGFVTDLFERITLFDNRAKQATWKRLPDGRFEVKLAFSAKKLYADGQGVETEAKLDDWLEVGVFARQPGESEAKEKVLALERRRFAESEGEITLVVDQQPFEAGIDPYNKTIDRSSDDNRTKVSEAGT
ncbi:MAG TPA: M1 family aminopeptidase [Thermoanaerobaculia bacterium]|nr:M1 family aminopeptidase [Thermoanaerobaculia bacterium]